MNKENLNLFKVIAVICWIVAYFLGIKVGMNRDKIRANERFNQGIEWIRGQEFIRCQVNVDYGFYFKIDCIEDAINNFEADFLRKTNR